MDDRSAGEKDAQNWMIGAQLPTPTAQLVATPIRRSVRLCVVIPVALRDGR